MNAKARSGHPIIIGIVVVIVVLAALFTLAFGVVSGGDSDSDTKSEFDTANSTVKGSPLPPLPQSGNDDPAIGQTAPEIEGIEPGGEAQIAPASGSPSVILFVAHWCPHCQKEIPAIQKWLDDGNMDPDVGFFAVSTNVNKQRPNYPPSKWLKDAKWTLSTIADADGIAAEAYGVSAFPYWVVVDANGKVTERFTGEVPTDMLSEVMKRAKSGTQ